MNEGEAEDKTSANVALSKRVAVIMQRRLLDNRWQSETWEPVGVLTGYEGPADPRVLVEEANTKQWLFPGFDIILRRSEAEGYYHNVSAQEPKVFVLWRMQSACVGVDGECAVPQYVTVSYDEASRWMDGGESVDSVAMPAELFTWVGEFVESNYRFTPKKRIRPQSFKSPKDRTAR